MTFKSKGAPKLVTSAKALEKLSEPGRYRDHEIRGLYLQITNPKNKSWVLRFQVERRPRALGLGPYPLVSLAKARQLARDVRLEILGGVDPVETRKERKAALAAKRAKALTFRQASERYFAKKAAEWKTVRQRNAFNAMMRAYVLPVLGDLEIEAIDTAGVLRVLEPIWSKKPTIAAAIRGHIEKILSWAQAAGFRSSDANPARLAGHLAEMLPSHGKIKPTQHHAALGVMEVPQFMAALRAQNDATSRALEFLILTACRREEALNAVWSEIDLDEKIWIIPADRMKTRREHRVPLSTRAIAILESLYREDGNERLFIGSKHGSGLSKLYKLLKRMGRDDVTVHGFRSSFRDWCGDHSEFPREIAEAALAHKVGDATEQSYRRSDALEKRRRLMEQWSRYCSGEEQHENVVPLRR